MNREIQSKLNEISRKSLDNLLCDLLKKHKTSISKPKLSPQEKKDLRLLVKDFQSAYNQITKSLDNTKK